MEEPKPGRSLALSANIQIRRTSDSARREFVLPCTVNQEQTSLIVWSSSRDSQLSKLGEQGAAFAHYLKGLGVIDKAIFNGKQVTVALHDHGVDANLAMWTKVQAEIVAFLQNLLRAPDEDELEIVQDSSALTTLIRQLFECVHEEARASLAKSLEASC